MADLGNNANYNAQVGEALAGVKALNKMTGLGTPVRQQVN
jgi:hypothetical protein